MNPSSEVSTNASTRIEANYIFGGEATPIVVLSWTTSGQPVIAWPDGRVEVVERHRVRLARRDLP